MGENIIIIIIFLVHMIVWILFLIPLSEPRDNLSNARAVVGY